MVSLFKQYIANFHISLRVLKCMLFQQQAVLKSLVMFFRIRSKLIFNHCERHCLCIISGAKSLSIIQKKNIIIYAMYHSYIHKDVNKMFLCFSSSLQNFRYNFVARSTLESLQFGLNSLL